MDDGADPYEVTSPDAGRDLAATPELEGERLNEPVTPDPNLARRLEALSHGWSYAIVQVSFVPGGPALIHDVLHESLRQLAGALTAASFDPMVGYRVGFDLVDARITSPQALGCTLTLLHQLIDRLAIQHQQAPERLILLLSQLATGFTEATCNVAIASAEDINRAERAAWRARQAALNNQLQQALLCDRLTGLPNRAKLTSWLGELLTELSGPTRLGICLINLDRFKAVNDSLGHDKGDRLLSAVALRLRRLADHTGYFLAHLGGDEFSLIAKNTNGYDDMAKVADLALRTLRDPFTLDGHHLSVSASAGIVECAAADAHPIDLVRNADIALGWAKTQQRGRWASFDPHRYQDELHRHALTADMPVALARGKFTLAYQPLIRFADRRIIGAEALARWQHPDHGPVSPSEFIPLAEHTGLIVPLGQRLLEQACHQTVAWTRQGHDPFMISVNLSAVQLRTPGLTAAIAATLEQTGLPAEQLQLEITESTIVSSGDDSLETLHALARSGIRLAIDDFGTGYSSLAYLTDLPIHAVKLAPRFLKGIGRADGHHSNATVLPALIKLSHDLGLTVTAEGIETSAQAKQLTILGCDLGQGFHLGRPTTAQRLPRLLAKRNP
jgi:diguanylate cyclase (GGDEF)-like protein